MVKLHWLATSVKSVYISPTCWKISINALWYFLYSRKMYVSRRGIRGSDKAHFFLFLKLELDLRIKGNNAAPYWQIRSKNFWQSIIKQTTFVHGYSYSDRKRISLQKVAYSRLPSVYRAENFTNRNRTAPNTREKVRCPIFLAALILIAEVFATTYRAISTVSFLSIESFVS